MIVIPVAAVNPAEEERPMINSMRGMAKGALVILSAIGLFIFLLVIWVLQSYNGVVTLEEGVASAWGKVEATYQRRIDLIPNLVSTVKAYADHEEGVFAEVARIRAEAGKIQLSAEDLNNPEMVARFQNVQQGLGSALTKLFAVAEAYPALRASENFLGLQTQLEGTENRISVARQRYNDAVKEYNSAIRRIPGLWVAAAGGFEQSHYFKSDAGADQAVEVSFD